MTGYWELRDTLYSIPKAEKLVYERRPGLARGSHRPELVGLQFGWVKISSPETQVINGSRMIPTKCTNCGREKWINLNSLLSGRTAGCSTCSRPQLVPTWLLSRCSDAKGRCQSPTHHSYDNYGARGIEFRFATTTHMAVYVQRELGLYREKEIARINNGGHYEEGNLRLAGRVLNASNKRGSKVLRFHQFRQKYPAVLYADNTLKNLISRGLTDEEIMEKWTQPSCKPKGKYGTFSTPDLVLVSQLMEGL